MIIKMRPGGLAPSSFDVGKVYQEIREDAEVVIASTELLYRLLVGVADGEITYGNTAVSCYDDKGFRHSTGVTPNGSFYDTSIMNAFPMSGVTDSINFLKTREDYRELNPNYCGNCSYNSAGLCQSTKSERGNSFVADFEDQCDDFSDAFRDYLMIKAIAGGQKN